MLLACSCFCPFDRRWFALSFSVSHLFLTTTVWVRMSLISSGGG
jgi:hypothetical protein